MVCLIWSQHKVQTVVALNCSAARVTHPLSKESARYYRSQASPIVAENMVIAARKAIDQLERNPGDKSRPIGATKSRPNGSTKRRGIFGFGRVSF